MHGTHCKHYLFIPPLASNNNCALLRCWYMCAGTLVYMSRHLSRTSNNNKRCQLIIRCMFCNSGRMDLEYDDVRYMVSRWEFSCLDYSFNVLISRSHKLDCTTGFAIFAFIGFYFRFLVLLLLLLLYYICIHPGLPLVYYRHWSPVLIILYHTCSLLDITYYLYAYSCMPVLMTRFSIHTLLI